MVVDDPLSPEEEAGLPQKEHTLKCLPMAPGEGDSMSLECKESEAEPEPLIVVISTAGLGLRDILRKNVKLVVKEFMLMDMQATARSQSIQSTTPVSSQTVLIPKK